MANIGKIDLGSQIVAMISDDKVVYVSLKDGQIVYFPNKNMTPDALKVL